MKIYKHETSTVSGLCSVVVNLEHHRIESHKNISAAIELLRETQDQTLAMAVTVLLENARKELEDMQ